MFDQNREEKRTRRRRANEVNRSMQAREADTDKEDKSESA